MSEAIRNPAVSQVKTAEDLLGPEIEPVREAVCRAVEARLRAAEVSDPRVRSRVNYLANEVLKCHRQAEQELGRHNLERELLGPAGADEQDILKKTVGRLGLHRARANRALRLCERALVSSACPVRLQGEGRPIRILNDEVPGLTGRIYKIIDVLVRAYPEGRTRENLRVVTGCDKDVDIRDSLRDLFRRHPVWATVHQYDKGNGKGRKGRPGVHRIVHPPTV